MPPTFLTSSGCLLARLLISSKAILAFNSTSDDVVSFELDQNAFFNYNESNKKIEIKSIS